MFSLQQNWYKRFYRAAESGQDIANTVHTQVSKCKNDKKKGNNNKIYTTNPQDAFSK
jgi:hypothetical protein